MTRILVLAALLLAQPAGAATPLARAESLYREGALSKAAELARAAGGANGHSLAAKATLVDALWRAPEAQQAALLDQVVEDATRALELDPELVEAHLQLAIALGRLGDLEDPISAHVKGYASEGKRHLDEALELAPNDPWAHALVGIWHLQLVRRAGAGLAEELYGAREDEGLAHCRDALALAPKEPNLGFGCALSLLQLDSDAYRRDALTLLEAIRRHEPGDAAGRLVQAEAARVVARVRAGEPPS